jgi:hypothetical protein
VTDLFAEAVALGGRRLERSATADGTRGIGVAIRDADGARELVTVIGAGVEAADIAAHDGWDLPLVEQRLVNTSSGPRLLLAEALRAGVPSTWLRSEPRGEHVLPVPRHGAALAERIVDEHRRGGAVGRLHPATVLIDPDTHALVAVAQRPLRVARAVPGEGHRPLLGYAFWSPNDATANPPSMADDVFRLAVLLWVWRHDAHPLGHLRDAEMLVMLGRLGGGVAAPLPAPADDLDRLLLACLVPSPTARPTSAELVVALEAGS